MTKFIAKIILQPLCLSAVVVISQSAFSWGQTGHRISGDIAERHLTKKAKQSIQGILPNESLAEASTYADEMRSNPEHYWKKIAGAYHYVTVPDGTTYSTIGAPKQGDAVSALKEFKSILTSPSSSLEQKQLALRFTVHIIGDLHQPLHAGNGKDKGGNDVRIEFFKEHSNLHRVWDSGMIDKKKLSYSEWSHWLNQKITPTLKKQWHSLSPIDWVNESQTLRKTIYPSGSRLSWNYLYQHTPTVKLRLQQSGVRIADYLNDVFK